MDSKRRDLLKATLALSALVATGAVVGCNASQWLANLQKYLPILLQVALNIAQVIGFATSEGKIAAALSLEMQKIAKEVSDDLVLLQSLVAQYNAAPDKTALYDKIQVTLGIVQTNLQAILTSFHVNDKALQTLVSTAVGAAVATVMAILALMPVKTATAQRGGGRIMAKSHKPEDVLQAVIDEIFRETGYSNAS
jgi:hypothetical protein